MPASHIHQIYYSEQTRLALDPGFIALDNMKNERPDWREYWPMRNYLINRVLQEEDFYGFFSPKFKAKTNLDSGTVAAYIQQHQDADVILFSPFFDQGAFPLNIFVQGAAQHAEIMEVFKGSAELLKPGVALDSLIMDSRNTVFCNYFVAKPRFWRHWLDQCEAIFRVAEEGASELGKKLNAGTNHDGGSAPNKVFVTERVASLLLTLEKGWKVATYNSVTLPFSTAPIARFVRELILMDSLKIACATQGHPQYLSEFLNVRLSILQGLQQGRA